MNQSGVEGEYVGETFYQHNLKHYMPHIMRYTYENHAVGPAIFTMEGFECKNYTSKQVMRCCKNGQGIQCMQSLRVMQLLCINDHFSVSDELKKQQRKGNK